MSKRKVKKEVASYCRKIGLSFDKEDIGVALNLILESHGRLRQRNTRESLWVNLLSNKKRKKLKKWGYFDL